METPDDQKPGSNSPAALAFPPDGKRFPNRMFFAVFFASVFFSIVIRGSFFNYETSDYILYFSKWYDYIIAHGRWRSLKDDFSSYSELYLCFLSLASWLPLPKLYVIKAMAVLFDYIAALLVFKIVRLQCKDALRPALAAALTLFLPTMLVNGALWGQCDAIYTSALLATLYGLLRQKTVAALAAYGVALALKPQAVCFLPFMGGLFAGRILPWRAAIIPVAVYVLCGLPSVLAGKPVADMVLHWFHQSNVRRLSIEAPNWYQWVPASNGLGYRLAGYDLAGVASLGLVCWIGIRRGGGDRREWMVTAALFSALLVPFLLPGMHERYFFSADILSLIYAFYVPRRWGVPVLVQGASFCSYSLYLLHVIVVPEFILALAMAAALIIVGVDFARMTRPAQGAAGEVAR